MMPARAIVRLEVSADLHLHVGEPRGDGLADEQLDLLVLVSEPAGGRRVRRVPGADDLRLALGRAAAGVAEDLQRLVGREHVRDVAEVDAADELLRCEIHEQLPEGLPLPLGPEIPDGVDHRGGREMDDALLGAEPAELGVGHEAAPEPAHVGDDRLERATDDEWLEGAGGGHTDLGPPPAGERQTMTLEPIGGARSQDDVRRRVVRVGVHRVGSIQPAGRREADVTRLESDDRGSSGHGSHLETTATDAFTGRILCDCPTTVRREFKRKDPIFVKRVLTDRFHRSP